MENVDVPWNLYIYYTYVRYVHLICLYLLPIGQFALIHAPIQMIDTHTLVKTIGNCESEDDVFVTTTDSIVTISPASTT